MSPFRGHRDSRLDLGQAASRGSRVDLELNTSDVFRTPRLRPTLWEGDIFEVAARNCTERTPRRDRARRAVRYGHTSGTQSSDLDIEITFSVNAAVAAIQRRPISDDRVETSADRREIAAALTAVCPNRSKNGCPT